MSKAVPAYLGPYRLLSVVHSGHTTQVWKAFSEAKQGFFAVKILQEKFHHSRTHVQLLKHERAVGAKITHPRIIGDLEFATDCDIPYLAMEWFPAPNMKNRIRQELEKMAPLVPKIVLQATEATCFLHSRGWIHRDIKPQNFLLAADGEVRMIDLALARRKSGFFGRIFPTKSKIQGTRSYMSPEQIRGEPLDERADLYSLGCTFYELVAGKPPFTGTNSSELLKKHLKASPPPLEAVHENVTHEFSQLIHRVMAKQPAARAASSQEFYSELQRTVIFRQTPAA